MSISFSNPSALWLLVPVVGLTLLLSAAARHHLSLTRRRLAIALRVVVLSALAFALAGFQLVLPVDKLTTVFVVDLSDSVGASGRADALAFVREALKTKPDGDRAGIVAFGGEALVERLPAELRELDGFASVPARAATDVGAALRLAAALFPDETQKRIVLLSDGNDTTGRGASEAALAAARGVQVETRVVGIGAADEVLIERVRTPSTARVGEEIEVEVSIRSNVRQPATVRLFGDGAQVGSLQVTLEPGMNRVVFAIKAKEAGFHTFRAVVEADRDTFSENDRADSDTIVKGEPRVLVVAGDARAAGQLVRALRAERHQVSEVVPERLPTSIVDLASYDSVVLVDAPATRMSVRQMEALRSFTRDLGRGLVAVGGPRAYGAGGYKGTPLEEALPVDMDVRSRDKQPDVALVVVIDQSGSMDACHCNTASQDNGSAIGGVPKVDIGKEAILRAVAALTARDEFGVVGFNENAHWHIRTAPLGQVGDVANAIGGIKPEGNTNIYSGLSEAVASLEKASATRRHVILLTDGWSSTGAYEQLLARMKTAGITLSTVGAGAGSSEFLKELAKKGGGRFYNAINPASIPDIFLKETQQVAGQQIIEEPFFPIQTASSPILRGLESGLPRLLGYNGTTPKSAAQTVLVSSRDDPVLAQWQYGLGRSVAWTSDATARWARNWVGWPGFNRFVSQMVTWTFPGEETAGIEAEFVTDGDQTRLRVRSFESDGTPRNFYDTVVNLVGPTMVADTGMRLDQVAPGEYEVLLGRLDPGAYALRVMQMKPGATALGRTLGLVAQTPAEYRLLGTNERLLASLRQATGGRGLDAPEQAWRHDLKATAFATDLWPLLLILAMLLWPLDIALRRVNLSRRELADARVWVGERVGRRRRAAARGQAADVMLAAKGRAAGSRSRVALLRAEATSEIAAGPAVPGPAPAAGPSRSPGGTSATGPSGASRESVPVATGSSAAPAPPVPAVPGTPPTASTGPDTLARLRDAKRRAGR